MKCLCKLDSFKMFTCAEWVFKVLNSAGFSEKIHSSHSQSDIRVSESVQDRSRGSVMNCGSKCE